VRRRKKKKKKVEDLIKKIFRRVKEMNKGETFIIHEQRVS